MNQIASHFRRLGESDPKSDRVPLGQMLLGYGALSVGDLLEGLSLHKQLGVPLGKALLTQGSVLEPALYDHLAMQWEAPRQRDISIIDPDLLESIGLDNCLRHKTFPLNVSNGVVRLAVSQLSDFDNAYADLEDQFGLITPVISSPSEIAAAIQNAFKDQLADRAAHDIPKSESCRGLAEHTQRRSLLGLAMAISLLACAILWPSTVLVILTILAITLSLSSAVLKSLALASHSLPDRDERPEESDLPANPSVSIMVPLHREPKIVKALGADPDN